MADIVRSAEEITAAWIESALGAPVGSIESFEVRRVGTGQVAASYRLTLNWKEPGRPESLIAKCASTDLTSRATALRLLLYRREVAWYQELAPKTDIRCPKSYYSAISPDCEWFNLLLEDCAPAYQGDQLRGASLAEVRAALGEAAALHANFLGQPWLVTSEFLNVDRSNRAGTREMYARFWPDFKERYSVRLAPELFEMGDAFAARFDQYLNHEPDVYTVSHNDFRIDNMLFGAPDGRVVILDWQTISAGHPLADVSYLIGTSVANPPERRAAERGLVRFYYDALRARGAIMSWSRVWEAYRYYAFAGFVMAVISCMLVERTERGDEMFAVMAERPARQIMDLESLSLL